MRIQVNGSSVETVPAITIEGLLQQLGYENQMVAVAINASCVPRQTFAEQSLQESDIIEILAPMAGG